MPSTLPRRPQRLNAAQAGHTLTAIAHNGTRGSVRGADAHAPADAPAGRGNCHGPRGRIRVMLGSLATRGVG